MQPQFSIQVPRSAWPAFTRLLQMPEEELEKLLAHLQTADPLPDVEDLAEQCQRATGIPESQANDIISIGINFNRLQRGLDTTPAEILDSVSRSLERSGFPEWHDKYAAAWGKRRNLLEKLFVADGAIEIMSKVRELLFEFQCVFRTGAVLTDVRHIYNNAGTDIKGGLVLHTLSLSFREGEEHRRIHLTLSSQDIKLLISQLQRAQQKATVATKLLEELSLPELTPKRDLQP